MDATGGSLLEGCDIAVRWHTAVWQASLPQPIRG